MFITMKTFNGILELYSNEKELPVALTRIRTECVYKNEGGRAIRTFTRILSRLLGLTITRKWLFAVQYSLKSERTRSFGLLAQKN